MKIIKTLAFVLFIQGTVTAAFAAGAAPTAQDYLANAAFCNNPVNNCTAAQIGTVDGGGRAWVTNGTTNGNGNGILCANGFSWSSSLGMCVPSGSQTNSPCTYMSGTNSVTQPSGATWDCACSGTTVNLATCTCTNGTVTRSEAGCEKFTKYQVCPSNPCKTQTGSCYKGEPNNCVWASCASATNTSLPSGSTATNSTVTHSLP